MIPDTSRHIQISQLTLDFFWQAPIASCIPIRGENLCLVSKALIGLQRLKAATGRVVVVEAVEEQVVHHAGNFFVTGKGATRIVTETLGDAFDTRSGLHEDTGNFLDDQEILLILWRLAAKRLALETHDSAFGKHTAAIRKIEVTTRYTATTRCKGYQIADGGEPIFFGLQNNKFKQQLAFWRSFVRMKASNNTHGWKKYIYINRRKNVLQYSDNEH